MEERFKSWDEFKAQIGRIASVPQLTAGWDYAFRGCTDASWKLTTTLDRARSFTSNGERGRYEDDLLNDFRREAVALLPPESDLPNGNALALLARHHGLPSSWLDWTTSPYVAAYFAYSGRAKDDRKPRLAIWCVTRARMGDLIHPDDIVDDPALLRFNPRANRQRGIFIRSSSIVPPIETTLRPALIKFVMPASMNQKRQALTELDLMTINATTLFGDLDGAARTSIDRMERRALE
jgi:hypothetical protein